jgi:CheY-like chemotaxis protein
MNTPLSILVAEDELKDVLLLRHAFAKAGVKAPVYFANDGQEVLDYLQGNSPFDNPVEFPLPNLLLLDLKLPRVSGFEVLEWLRQQPRLKHLLVVVLSNSGNPEAMTRAYSLGANAYVVKPHEPKELVSIVARLQNYWLSINAESDLVLAAPVFLAA